MVKIITEVFGSIILGFISAVLLGEGDDGETIILASIFWLLASMHYGLSQKRR